MILKQIITDQKIMKIENGKIPTLAIESLNEMINPVSIIQRL